MPKATNTKNIYPKFYKDFKCIANKCPDSCCKDWDVQVDDRSIAYYDTVQTEFGNFLRSNIITDKNDDIIFTSNNGKCTFWNKDMLCDIYINLGEEHLCCTCKEFPRVKNNYKQFCEHILSFACPVAARLMLKADNPFDCIEEFEVTGDNLDYSPQLMNFLLAARKHSCKIFERKDLTFEQRIELCLKFNQAVQGLLEDELFDKNELDELETMLSPTSDFELNYNDIFDLHLDMDYMSDKWLEFTKAAVKVDLTSQKAHELSKKLDDKFTTLALYYIFRYYIGAVDSYETAITVRKIECAYVMILAMIIAAGAEDDFEAQATIFQRYSKELEHSDENSMRLEDHFLWEW